MKALEIKWEYHTPWHPPSSGRVERMNQTLKNELTKLVVETRLLWTKCFPVELLRISTAPWKDIGLSPYEMLLMYLPLKSDYFFKNYILGLSSTLLCLRKKGLLAQAPPLSCSPTPAWQSCAGNKISLSQLGKEPPWSC
jgi:hypothetical protein